MREQILSVVVQIVLSLLGIVGTYVLGQAARFIRGKREKIAISGKVEKYNYALTVARGIYSVLEDKFKDLAKAGVYKKAEMEKQLLQLVPALTQVELDSINKEICQEFKLQIVDNILTPIEKTDNEIVQTNAAEG